MSEHVLNTRSTTQWGIMGKKWYGYPTPPCSDTLLKLSLPVTDGDERAHVEHREHLPPQHYEGKKKKDIATPLPTLQT